MKHLCQLTLDQKVKKGREGEPVWQEPPPPKKKNLVISHRYQPINVSASLMFLNITKNNTLKFIASAQDILLQVLSMTLSLITLITHR